MAVQKNHRSSFPQQAASVLAEEITERVLPPGERLLEQTLSERFGTSRAPIREALYKVRVTLEELALERDCDGLRMVHLSLTALRPIVGEMEKSRRAVKRYHGLNFEFHKAIVELSRSSVLSRLYTQIEGPMKMFLLLSMTTKADVSKSIEDHKRIVAAIAEGDAAEASKALRAHEVDGMAQALAALREGRAP